MKAQNCDKLRTRSTFSEYVMASVNMSKLGLTDHVSRSGDEDQFRLLGLHWNFPVTPAAAHDAWPVRRFLHLSTTQRTCTPGTWHCDFLSSQRLRSFLQICGRRTTPTLSPWQTIQVSGTRNSYENLVQKLVYTSRTQNHPSCSYRKRAGWQRRRFSCRCNVVAIVFLH